jgi:hypothetical protein
MVVGLTAWRQRRNERRDGTKTHDERMSGLTHQNDLGHVMGSAIAEVPSRARSR